VTNPRHFLPSARSRLAHTARAYLNDLPEAELHLLDTGHFATATHSDEIAARITAFLDTRVATPAPS
jgi:hypothetical protein